MKALYLDCGNGSSGDMICAALWELVEDQETFLQKLDAAGLPGVKFYPLPAERRGVSGTHFEVRCGGQLEETEVLSPDDPTEIHIDTPHDRHSHRTLADIEAIIRQLHISDRTMENSIHIYELLAEAESHVHGTTVTEIHFHEVGAIDAIADIVCASMLIEELHPDKVLASSIQTGSGKVRCEHGIMPIPAPATAYLLKGMPIFSSGIHGELCTPTGAVLLKYYVDKFVPMPVMNIQNIGYGMGSKDYEHGNYLRAFLGETKSDPALASDSSSEPENDTAHVSGLSDASERRLIRNRIARSVGHLDSVKRMVEDNRDTDDILIQLAAVESSIAGTSRAIMKGRLKEAVSSAQDKGQLEELYHVIDRFIK